VGSGGRGGGGEVRSHIIVTVTAWWTAPMFIRFIVRESHQEGVNRRNLKIINFEHTLHPRLGLEINNLESGVRKIVPLAMSCLINADNFGSKLKTI
jgi:hypothetical protein